MASGTASPNFLRRRCMCNWGAECLQLKKLLAEADDVLLTRMIHIQPGGSETSVALRSVVKLHFKLGLEHDDKVLYVAAHHWAPLLISRNYKGSKGNRASRQFKILLTRSEAGSYDCSMDEKTNNFESCMKRSGVSILRSDERRQLFAQAPTNTLSRVRSYFQGLTGDRAVRLRERLLVEQNLEPLAVPKAISSASPLRQIASPASPDVIPSASTFQNYIRERQKKCDDKTSSHPKFLEAFRMLRTFHKTFDAIECPTNPKVFLYPCRGDLGSNLCLKYCVRYRRFPVAYCDYCGQLKNKIFRAERIRQKLKVEDAEGNRTAVNSRTPFMALSPGEKKMRMANLARDRKKLRLSAERLRTALDSSRAKFKYLDCGSGFRSLISKAFETLAKLDAEEKAEAKQHIIKELVGVGGDCDKINKEEASDFASYLMTEIDNKGKQLSGKPNQVEFTPAIFQTAVVLYLRSKVGYKDQRKLSPLVMPSTSTLDRLLRETRLNEGYSPKIYGNFFDEYVSRQTLVMGHLIFDEMKLKTGVFWRTSDHTVCGFASSNQNSTIRSVLSDMVQNSDDGTEEFYDTSAPAVYVNQWRFRSVYNVIHNSNFYFNCGSLDGNELLNQMIHVVCGYEKIGVRIYGIVCDAGGSNRGLFKLLREGIKPVLAGVKRVAAEHLTFKNPYDPSRRIAFFNCSTHNLKNIRNALLESDFPRGKRRFQFQGVPFGWKHIRETFDRDCERERANTVRETRLKFAGTKPDQWEKMDVGLALSVFKHDTISEQALHIATGLGKRDAFLEWLRVTPRADTDDSTFCSNFVALYRDQLRFLKSEMSKQLAPSIFDPTNPVSQWKSKINTLEYSVATATLFNELFMNKKKKITLKNLESVRLHVDEALDFFVRWHTEHEIALAAERVKEPKDRDAKIDTHFLSKITHGNIRTAIDGFFEYASLVLNAPGGPQYVPFLHSNSSVLEALFSQIRSLNRDTPERYISGLGAINTSQCIRYLDRNKMYTADTAGDVTAVDPMEALLLRKTKIRTAKIAEWKSLSTRTLIEEGVQAGRFESTYEVTDQLLVPFFLILREDSIGTGFVRLLSTSNNLFEEFAFASILTPLEHWYESVYGLQSEHHMVFNSVCQRILGDLFGMFVAALLAPKTTIRAKYYLHVLGYLQGEPGSKFTVRIQEMPLAALQKRAGVIDLVQVLSQMLMRWVTASMTTLSQRLNGLVLESQEGDRMLDAENEKREVNRFLGWAIWNLRCKLSKRRNRAKANDWVLSENVEPLIQHLDGMRCFHHHAIIDEEYMKNCYSQADQSRNGGWLSLVSKDYFEFGKVLLSQIRDKVQQKQWGRNGNASIKVAAEPICKDAAIKKTFFDACTGSSVPASVLQSLLDRIVLKVFHARAGASMDAWKRKNTAREVKGSADASLRADLKSKVSQATKKAGEFQIRKRGGNLPTRTVSKKMKP